MLNSKAEYLAKKYLLNAPQDQQMGALQRALSEMPPNVPNSLQQLITAHNLLKKSQEQQQRQQALALAQQGQVAPSGGFARSVKDDVAQALAAENQQLEAQLMAREAAPMRAGGIAELPVQNFSENSFAGGGIVALAEGGETEEATSRAGRALRGLFGLASTPEDYARVKAEKENWLAQRELRKQANMATPGFFEALTPAQQAQRDAQVQSYNRSIAALQSQSAIPAVPAASTPEEKSVAQTKESSTVPVARKTVDAGATDVGGGDRSGLKSLLPPELQQMQKDLIGRLSRDERPESLTLEEANRRIKEEDSKALREAGLSEKPYEERIAEMKGEAQQALKDRDTDRLLALAQGFFAMGASKSPRLLESMSEGFGVTTKELKSVESEYRKAEKARKDAEATLKQAQRAEVLNQPKRAQELYEKNQSLMERYHATKTAADASLLNRITGIEHVIGHQESGARARLTGRTAFSCDGKELRAGAAAR
ncbi:hypothetical protein EBT31_17500, partial [bacterium]|nr:hypothetical protein [bacterium]